MEWASEIIAGGTVALFSWLTAFLIGLDVYKLLFDLFVVFGMCILAAIILFGYDQAMLVIIANAVQFLRDNIIGIILGEVTGTFAGSFAGLQH